MIKINRLIDEYYWDELPFLIEKFMSEAEIDSFYAFSDEYKTDLEVTKELIDQMILIHLSGDLNFTEFQFSQTYRRTRTSGINSHLSKKKIILLSKNINLSKMRKRLEEHLNNFFDSIPIESWVYDEEVKTLDTNFIKNLNEYWNIFSHVSKFSKFKETHEEER